MPPYNKIVHYLYIKLTKTNAKLKKSHSQSPLKNGSATPFRYKRPKPQKVSYYFQVLSGAPATYAPKRLCKAGREFYFCPENRSVHCLYII